MFCLFFGNSDNDVSIFQIDASTRCITSVLSVYRDDQELPEAFYTKKLKPAETRHDRAGMSGYH